MTAKLIKDHTDYHLVNDEQFIIGTTDKSMLSCTDKYKLSLKNCQAIERGYDLDELVSSKWDEFYTTRYKGDFLSFKEGFQKALELMGDKKFSKEQMFNVYAYIVKNGIVSGGEINDYIQSLQQTEWDVEIEMEEIQEIYRDGTTIYERVPKIDADGCLILKRV